MYWELQDNMEHPAYADKSESGRFFGKINLHLTPLNQPRSAPGAGKRTLRHAPRHPESMVRLQSIYPIHLAELLPTSAQKTAETVPKREYDLRGQKWPTPRAASRKIITYSSGDMPVAPVLFEKGRGGHSKSPDFPDFGSCPYQ